MKDISFRLSALQRFLCHGIRHIDYIDPEWIRAEYSKIDDTELYEYAKLNGVDSILAHTLNKSFEKELPSHWQDSYKLIDEKISAYMIELDRVAKILESNGITMIALKNSGITRAIYPYYGSCPMGDLDILVAKSDFRKAHKILVENNYTFKFRSELETEDLDEAEKGGGAEYSVQLPGNRHLWFELQWRPVAGRWIQPHQEPTSEDLVSRAISIDGCSVKVLSPEDNLLQVSLHTAKHSYVRAPGFRLHTDVDRIVHSYDIDWDQFCSKVLNLKIKTSVFFSLAMAKSLLNTPVPNSVLEKLAPSQLKIYIMKNWIEKVGVFEPDAKKWNKISYIFFVSLLFDSVGDWISGIFPSADEMMKKYHFKSSFLLPYYHCKRIFNLLLRRTLG